MDQRMAELLVAMQIGERERIAAAQRLVALAEGPRRSVIVHRIGVALIRVGRGLEGTVVASDPSRPATAATHGRQVGDVALAK